MRFPFFRHGGILIEDLTKGADSVRLPSPQDEKRNRWKTILVIGCALFLGIMLGLSLRHLI